MREVDKKWLVNKSIEMDEIRQKMIDITRKNGALFNEIIKIQEEFLEELKQISLERRDK